MRCRWRWDGWCGSSAASGWRPLEVRRRCADSAALAAAARRIARIRRRCWPRCLSRRLGVPLADGLLRRRRHTQPQSELTPPQRWENVRQAFSVRAGYHLKEGPRALGGRYSDDRRDVQRSGPRAAEGRRRARDGRGRRAGDSLRHAPTAQFEDDDARLGHDSTVCDWARAAASLPAGRRSGWRASCGGLGTRSSLSKLPRAATSSVAARSRRSARAACSRRRFSGRCLAGEVDLAVHSLKDLPTEPVEGLMLAAVPARESAADVIVLVARSEEPGARLRTRRVCSLLPQRARWHGQLAAAGAVAACAAGFAGRRRARECRHAAAEVGRRAVRCDRAGRGRVATAGAWRIAFRRCCRST